MRNWLFRLCLILVLPALALAVDTECGVDDDHNGTVTTFCSTTDADRDGATTATDCNDNDDTVVPDDDWYTTTGCTGGQVRRCNANGTGWSACAAFSCDATGSGACYYVDCSTGSDANAGTSALPWLTPKMFSWYQSGAPAGHHTPVAGDRYYLKNCTNYTTTYNPGDATTRLFVSKADGTAANKIRLQPYPGHTAKFQAAGTTRDGGPICAYFEGASDWDVRGIEFSACGVHVTGGVGNSDRFKFRYNKVHGMDGDENDNVAGIKLGLIANADVRYNKFWDNYDATPASGNRNSVHGIDIYRAEGSSIISWNKIDATVMGNGRAIREKHCDGSTTDQLTVEGNVALRTMPTSADPYAYNFCSHPIFRYNYYEGTFSNYHYALYMADLGGPTNFRQNGLARFNTFIGSHGLLYQPSREWDADGVGCSSCATLGTWDFSDNIVKDTDTAYAGDEATNEVCQYGSDFYYTDIVTGGKISFARNSYDTVSTVFKGMRFSSTTASSSGVCGEPGSTGNLYGSTVTTFADWQAFGYDVAGYEGTVTFNADNIATNLESDDAGWNQYLAVAPTPTPTPTPAPGGIASKRWFRGGRF